MKNFGNAYLVDRLRDRAESLYDGRPRWIVGRLRFGDLGPRGNGVDFDHLRPSKVNLTVPMESPWVL